MQNIIIFFLFAAALLAFLFLISAKKGGKKMAGELPGAYKILLQQNVIFYNKLSEPQKFQFEDRVQHFLSSVKITGVGTEVEDIDRTLAGASAIIPIFAFPDWEYNNLHEILLYPETFNEQFEQTGNDRPVMGMVGSGAMNHIMILSKHALREGFSNKTDKNNTALHEFIHLIDKTDGDTDGIPETLLQHQYVLPWVNMIHKNIKEILKDNSDINPYGATNQAEFFAVVSEYFFERPDLMRRKHPELYDMLEKMFRKDEMSHS
ncbi:MAG: zinc-dependent peptidase [Chitinophagaceae bacterium]|nr:zinc-dependent peptidase [Chitinophagaceae bacterium]